MLCCAARTSISNDDASDPRPLRDLALALGGLAQVVVGWLFFRLPGVAFWTFAAVWRAGNYLSAVGVALWVGGLTIASVGIVIELLTNSPW
jgi:hypothetical protein